MNWVKCTDMRKQPIFVNIENACLSLIVATMNQHGNSRGFGPARGIETFESCQGGPCHSFPDPTVPCEAYR